MAEKTYYYIKLEDTYFGSKFQKAMRKLPGGAEMLICYLKMQLRYARDNGYITFDGIYDTIEEEIAEDIDESVENVKMTTAYMRRFGYFEQTKENLYFLPEMQPRIGSKTDVAMRVEKHRALKKETKKLPENDEMLQCNKNVTLRASSSSSNSIFNFNSNYYKENEELIGDDLLIVNLSKAEYDKLINKYQLEATERAIIKLNTYLLDNKKKQKEYSSHYRVILKWVMNRVQEDMIREQELEQREKKINGNGNSHNHQQPKKESSVEQVWRLAKEMTEGAQ